MGIHQRNYYAREKAERIISEINGFGSPRYIGAFGGVDGVQFNSLFVWNRFFKHKEVKTLYIPFNIKISNKTIPIELLPGTK